MTARSCRSARSPLPASLALAAWGVVLGGCDARIGHPSALWALWSLPALAAFYLLALRNRAARLRRFASPAMIERLTGGGGARRSVTKAILVTIAVAALLLTLAQLQVGYTWEEVQRRGVDIVIALDVSDSMRVEDAGRQLSRLDRAKREIHDLLGMMAGDRVGIVAFAGAAFVQCPMTLDYGAAELFLDALDTESVPVQGTDLAQALETSLQAFRGGAAGSRAILLITDGEDHSGRAVEVAKALEEEGVRVFAIGIGSEQGAPIPAANGGFRRDRSGSIILSRLDEPTLQQIALTTGGRYVRSVTGDLDLEQIYVDGIKAQLTEHEFEAHRRQRWEDRFQWLLAVALAALMIDGLVPEAAGTRRRARVATRASAMPGEATLARVATPGRSRAAAAALGLGLLILAAPRIEAQAKPAAPGSEQARDGSKDEAKGTAPGATAAGATAAGGAASGSTAAGSPADNAAAAPAKHYRTPEQAYQAGDYSQALDGFLDLEVERPQDPAVKMDVGSSHYRLGDLDAAGKSFESAGAAGDDRLRAQAWYDLGNVAYRQSRFDQAIESYHRALDLDPKDQDAKFNLEVARVALERQKQQQQQQQQKQQQKPDPKQQQQQQQSGGDQKQQDQQQQQGSGGEPKPEKSRQNEDQQQGEQQQRAGEQQREEQQQGAEQKSGQERGAQAGAPEHGAEGTLSAAEAKRLLDSLEEGRPHRRVPPGRHRDQEKDW